MYHHSWTGEADLNGRDDPGCRIIRTGTEQSCRLDMRREPGCLQGKIGSFESNYGKLGRQS